MGSKTIAIVGGGITGLSAAYYLQQMIRNSGLDYKVKLIESSNRLGGKINTLKRDGYTIERGPDSLLSRKKSIMKLIEELDLMDEVVRNDTGQSFILIKNKLYKMPTGAYMGVPKQIRTFFTLDAVSMTGKIRALNDLVKRRSKMDEDQSLGAFMRHRFGNELVDKIIDPLLSGIYSGDLDQMSLMATFPNFYEMEQKYGSLVKGLQKTLPKPSKHAPKNRSGMFVSFKDGLETLVHRISDRLEPNTVLLNTHVDHIEKKDQHYHLLLETGDVIKADSLILATQHDAIPRLFSQYKFFDTFNDIPSTSSANVVLSFDQKDLKKDIDGTGFLVSKTSDVNITACTWTHKKWPTTTPEGKALVRCYVGRPSNPGVVNLSDEALVDLVLNDLKKTMKVKAEPEFHVVTRWKNARPQYNVGHLEKIAKVREHTSKNLPGVYLAGSSFEGAGIPDCVTQGEKAAEQVFSYIK
jgi:oxygen-dependent protoporphyrinogen oxidase